MATTAPKRHSVTGSKSSGSFPATLRYTSRRLKHPSGQQTMSAPTDVQSNAHNDHEQLGLICPRCQALTYLPKEAEVIFKEALGCHHAGCFNAFASMCRRTVQIVFEDLGEAGKLKLFDE